MCASQRVSYKTPWHNESERLFGAWARCRPTPRGERSHRRPVSSAPPSAAFRRGWVRASVGEAEQERTRWDPKDGELCVSRTKPEETLVEVRSDSDVQIDRQTWV